MKEKDNSERLSKKRFDKMLSEGTLKISETEDFQVVTKKALREKIEVEISEKGVEKKDIIELFIDTFLKSDSSYSEITNIEGDLEYVCDLIRNYVHQKNLDIYALNFETKILLSRTNFDFESLQKTVERWSKLITKRGLIELWDDEQNKILHLFITPLRKHFPIGYVDEANKFESIKKLLKTSLFTSKS